MKRLLFVDDAPEVLSAIRRSFFDSEYEVLTAHSGSQALAILKETEICLVVSDLRMPEMDGYELLSRIKSEYPYIIRIILSGYADERVVMKALQKNIAKVYLLKPWDNEILLKLVEQLLKTEDLLRGSNVLPLINNLEDLPTFKSSYRRILSLIDQDAELPDIITGIETDQSIASKILHIANSAFYGLRTGSVAKAVRYLGLNTIRGLVLTMPIADFSGYVDNSFARKQLEIAMRTNMLLSLIYERHLHKRMDEMSNLAGLLHNVGRTLLYTTHKRQYTEMLENTNHGDSVIYELERNAFGVTYSELGGFLLQWWDMPFTLVESAIYHNDPFDARIVNRELVMAVHIAHKYACESLSQDDGTEFYPQVFDCLKIDIPMLEKDILMEQDKWQKV